MYNHPISKVGALIRVSDLVECVARWYTSDGSFPLKLPPEPVSRRAIVTLHARWWAGTALYYIAPTIVIEFLRIFLVLSANSEFTYSS